MPYNQQNYRRIRQEYETKYLKAREDAERRRREIELLIPEVLTIHRELSGVGLEIMHASLEHAADNGHRFLPLKERSGKDHFVTAEQMVQLDEYITNALRHAAGEMAKGNIAADPYWHDGVRNACLWCEYKAACHFEECFGDKRRLRKSLSGAEFWGGLDRKKGGEQDGD